MIIQAPVAIDSVASVRWKNGGGTTRQLAVEPANATTSDFLWRISIAQIDAAGEFSAFPGVDRTILLWHGEGVVLRSHSWPDHRLDDPRDPFRFRGEEDVVCELLGGPTQDLNLMTRRGQVDATFVVISEESYSVPVCAEFFLVCASGRAQLVTLFSDEAMEIGANQFLRISNVELLQATIVAQNGALLVAIAVRALG